MQPKVNVIQIQRPNFDVIKMTIKGETPLIVSRFSEKAKRQILDKQMKKAAKKKEARTPKAEFEAAKYKMSNGKDGFPALCVKLAMVDSSRFVEGLPATVLRGTIFVIPDDMETGLVKIKYKKCKMVEDVVRLQGIGKPADLRFRPYYYDWSMDLKIKLDRDILSQEQVTNLLARAGVSNGLGEWRPERNGQFGMFSVA
jgi:hypothetical protein